MEYLVWGLAIVGVISLVKLMYGVVVHEPQERIPKSLPEGFDFLETLAIHLGAPILYDSRVEHLLNGDRIFPPMLAAIRDAKETVNFLSYVYWQGDIAVEFGLALSEAARRGVKVRVLLDAMGAARMKQELVDQMRDAGCEVEWFRPVRWYNLRRINGRTHRKVLVVDDVVAFTGGVGIADEWAGDARNEDEWRDDHFRITGPAVQALQTSFCDNWRVATNEILLGHRRAAHRQRAGDAALVQLLTSPPQDFSAVSFCYWLAAQAANRHLDITTPYFVPDMSVLGYLKEAAERGVRVRLLVPCDHNDSRMVRWASLTRYPALLEAGVEVYEYQRTMIHTKSVVIDDQLSLVGSANFDNRSLELNDEIVLAVKDQDLNAELTRSFEQDLESSKRITKEEFQRISLWQKALGWLAMTVREQL